jgi:hypothetical protein
VKFIKVEKLNFSEEKTSRKHEKYENSSQVSSKMPNLDLNESKTYENFKSKSLSRKNSYILSTQIQKIISDTN